MTNEHPITPPPELVQEWDDEGTNMLRPEYQQHLTARAARWGADQELEACCEWLKAKHWIEPEFCDELRAARRLKQPSLKEQSLALIDKIQGNKEMWNVRDLDVVRQALEQLE